MFICPKCQHEVAEGRFCANCGAPAPRGEEPLDPFVGQTLAGKYFVQQLLGRGGMGQVYKAIHLTLDKPVVVKLLDRLLLSDRALAQRFEREARLVSKLSHPNIVSIVDFGQTEDKMLFMVMEYLPGHSLASLIAEEAPIPDGRAIRLGAQILSGLAEAHALGIVHRDIKPENVVVVSRRHEPDFVKVLDFGIAKLNEPEDTRLTQTGTICGTPGYMSPEQARAEELDGRSDLYSVGVLLYELVTGKLPFEADTPMGLVTKHMIEIPVPPAQRRPDLRISRHLDALIVRALAKDRAARPFSADRMREELLACTAAIPYPGRVTPPPLPRPTVVLSQTPVPVAPKAPAPSQSVFGAPARITAREATGARPPPWPQPAPSAPTGSFRGLPGARGTSRAVDALPAPSPYWTGLPSEREFPRPPRAEWVAQLAARLSRVWAVLAFLLRAAGRRLEALARSLEARARDGVEALARSMERARPALRVLRAELARSPERMEPALRVLQGALARAREKAKAMLPVLRGERSLLIAAAVAMLLVVILAYALSEPGGKAERAEPAATPVAGELAAAAPPAEPPPTAAAAGEAREAPPANQAPASAAPAARVPAAAVPLAGEPAMAGSAEGEPAAGKSAPSARAQGEPAIRRGVERLIARPPGTINSLAFPPAKGYGILQIDAMPWADVWIGDYHLGYTPREVEIKAGRYRVEARYGDDRVKTRTVRVRAGRRQQPWRPMFDLPDGSKPTSTRSK